MDHPRSDRLRVWLVDKASHYHDHHGANNLLGHLPDAVNHQVLHAEMPGKRNINNGSDHKKGKTSYKPANNAPDEETADLFHQCGFVKEIDTRAKKQIGDGSESYKPAERETQTLKII